MAQSEDPESDSGRERRIEPSVMRTAGREVGIEGENSESSIIRSRSLFGFSRGTVSEPSSLLEKERHSRTVCPISGGVGPRCSR
jgi:hypothetical protein